MAQLESGASVCCGQQMDWLIAEASVGSQTWRLWRCGRCEAVRRTGWLPPTWGNKIAEICYHLGENLDAAIAASYGVGDGPPEPAKPAEPPAPAIELELALDPMGEVVLFSGEISSGTTTQQWVYVDSDGALVLAAYDLGPVSSEARGDSDYEYWVRVSAKDKEAVLTALREELGAEPAGHAGVDYALLGLMERKYSGNRRASFDFQRWLAAHLIPYCFDSYG